MRNIFLVLVMVLPSTIIAQTGSLFHEDFDAPSYADSVTVYNTNPSNNTQFSTTNTFYKSPGNSFHSKVVPFDTLVFTTQAFSTKGKHFVQLEFDHICKITFLQKAVIKVSIDNGITWVHLGSNQYKGESPTFNSLGYFNEISYPDSNSSLFWGGPTSATSNLTPNNNWFVHETFDLSSIAGKIHSTGDTGYSNVMVKFSLIHMAPISNTGSGWYIDDIKISGSDCELQSPLIHWDNYSYIKLEGDRYQSIETIKLRAKDAFNLNKGVDRVEITYSINNSPWVTDTMVQSYLVVCPDSSDFYFTFTGLTVNDTVDWYVRAFDCSCPNITRDPAAIATTNYYTFWIASAPPVKCGIVVNSILPVVIDSFPWVEDFSNSWQPGWGSGLTGTMHRGNMPLGHPSSGGENWLVSPPLNSFGYAWSVRSGNTPSISTGPTSGQYVYTEADQGTLNSVTQLITPCIDLSTITNCVNLEFDVHMYGADMGALRIDVDTGATSTQWYNNVWKQVGSLQVNQQSSWNRYAVSLNQFKGKVIKIRFVGIRGNGPHGDIALDNLKIYETNVSDIEIKNIVEPLPNRCGYSLNDSVALRIVNSGCFNLTAVPIKIEVEVTPGNKVVYWDTLQSIPAGLDTIYTIKQGIDLSFLGDNKLTVTIPGYVDPDSTNNSQTLTFRNKTTFSSFPYKVNFEGTTYNPGNLSSIKGTVDTSSFIDIGSNANNQWFVYDQFIPDLDTGPIGDLSGFGNFVTTKNVNEDLFKSECFDFTNLQNPQLSFWYHIYGTTPKSITVSVKQEDQFPIIVDHIQSMHTSEKEQYHLHVLDLSVYAGKQVEIMLWASGSGSGYVAIDDIGIYDEQEFDVGVTNVLPANNFVQFDSIKPKIRIKNYGNSSISNIPVTIEFKSICSGTTTTVTDTILNTLLPDSSIVHEIQQVPLYPAGDLKIKGYTTYNTDIHNLNDTFIVRGNCQPLLSVLNGYSQDFENCAEGTVDGYAASGTNRLFNVRGIGNSGNYTANSGNNCIVLGRPFDDDGYGEEVLYLPIFSGFDSLYYADLHFSHSFNGKSGAMGVLEYFNSVKSKWEIIGEYDLAKTGCDYIYDGVQSFIPGWFLNKSGTWKNECVQLKKVGPNNSVIRLRFRIFGTSTLGEWAIDDIEIDVPDKVDLDIEELKLTTYSTEQNKSFKVDLESINVGRDAVSNFLVYYYINGVFIDSIDVIPTTSILFGQVFNQQLDITHTGSTGSHELCIRIHKINGMLNSDTQDSLCLPLYTIKNTNLPYCADFESDKILESDNTLGLTESTIWEYGTPGQSNLNNAYSGSYVWMTRLKKNYGSGIESHLYLPGVSVIQNACYEVSFYHNYEMQNLLDGGNLEYSLDQGLTWSVLGQFGDSLWYNQPYVYAFGLNVPGFTGSSNGWIKSVWRGRFNKSGEVLLRFNFKSNSHIEDEGWAIDDLCIKNLGNHCSIGINEDRMANLYYYPNPADEYLNIDLLEVKEDIEVSIISVDGKVLLSELLNKELNNTQLDISDIAPGIYVLSYKIKGVIFSSKLIIY